jgi:hypothetical protein
MRPVLLLLCGSLALEPVLLFGHLDVERKVEDGRDARQLVKLYSFRDERAVRRVSRVEAEEWLPASDARWPDSCIDEKMRASPPRSRTSSTRRTKRLRFSVSLDLRHGGCRVSDDRSGCRIRRPLWTRRD